MLSFQQGDVAGEFTSDTWRVALHPEDGIKVLVDSRLSTPLDQFSEAPPWGVGARAPWGTEVIITPLGVDVLQHMAIWQGDLVAGLTPLGPVAGMELPLGPVGVQVTALLSNGEVLAAGELAVRAGDFTISYTFDPASSGIAVRFPINPLNVAISFDSSGLQMGLVYGLRNGPIVVASWSSADSFQVAVVASLQM